MRALRLNSTGIQPEITSISTKAPLLGQISVEVQACGLNFADLLMIKGTYQDTPSTPFTLGLELSGIVTGVGADVDDLAIGDHVAIYAGQGGLAQTGVFSANRAIRIPKDMPFEHAAALPVAYATSHIALNHCARLMAGETLLVTGAAGGVGLAAVEIGKRMGARVIAQARGAHKLAMATRAGADHVIDADQDLRATLLDLGGADVVYDAVGGDVFKAAFRATNPGGRLLPIGFASGDIPQIPANHLLVKNLSVIGFYIGGYLKHFPEVIGHSMAQLISWYGDGLLKPHISHVLPLDRATEGLALLRDRKATGKVIITPNR
jgi:NADPH2:quinone reductase